MRSTVSINAEVKNRTNDQMVVEVTIPLVRSMLSGEDVIQSAVNAVGMLGTKALLESFDTDGLPLFFGSVGFTSKGLVRKDYETPYGQVSIDRHVYQGSKGGGTLCPLEESARIIGSSTPKLAKIVSNKYSRSSVDEVMDDLRENHGRSISRGFIQSVADQVGSVAIEKESKWEYLTEVEDKVATIAIGMDGAMMLMREDGY